MITDSKHLKMDVNSKTVYLDPSYLEQGEYTGDTFQNSYLEVSQSSYSIKIPINVDLDKACEVLSLTFEAPVTQKTFLIGQGLQKFQMPDLI